MLYSLLILERILSDFTFQSNNSSENKKNSNLSKSISDVSWSKFIELLTYKDKWYGRDLIKINTFFASSQLYNNYGYKNEKVKELSIRK